MNTTKAHGVISLPDDDRRADFLFRVSLKAIIRNDKGQVLVVKETARSWWDLPGGGMDHDEDIKTALARELYEEVGLTGEFRHRIVAVEDPHFLPHARMYQMRLIFEVIPETLPTQPGSEADEIDYIDHETLRDSDNTAEKFAYRHVSALNT